VSKRIRQINILIKRELGQILSKEIEFSAGVLMTITRVETTSNLMESNIWISVFPEDKLRRCLEVLNKNIYILQQKLNKRLNMRPIPRIKFLEEKKTVEAGKVEEILEKMKVNK